MNTSLKNTTIAFAALAMLAPAFAWAQTPQEETEAKAPLTYVLRADIDGTDVRTNDEKSLGEVDELIVDTKTNQVVFAIVSTGGFLGIGDRLTAIPFEVIQWREEDDEVVLFCDISKKNLEMAPAFEHAKILDHLGNEQWRKEMRAAFGTYPKDAVITEPTVAGRSPSDKRATTVSLQDGPKLKTQRWRKAGEMVDAKIIAGTDNDGEKAKNETFGKVDDLIIHRKNRKVEALLVSAGGVIGINKDHYIIPCGALEQTEETDELCVNRSIDQMKNAPVLEKGALSRLENEEYRSGLAKFYGVGLDDKRGLDNKRDIDNKRRLDNK